MGKLEASLSRQFIILQGLGGACAVFVCSISILKLVVRILYINFSTTKNQLLSLLLSHYLLQYLRRRTPALLLKLMQVHLGFSFHYKYYFDGKREAPSKSDVALTKRIENLSVDVRLSPSKKSHFKCQKGHDCEKWVQAGVDVAIACQALISLERGQLNHLCLLTGDGDFETALHHIGSGCHGKDITIATFGHASHRINAYASAGNMDLDAMFLPALLSSPSSGRLAGRTTSTSTSVRSRPSPHSKKTSTMQTTTIGATTPSKFAGKKAKKKVRMKAAPGSLSSLSSPPRQQRTMKTNGHNPKKPGKKPSSQHKKKRKEKSKNRVSPPVREAPVTADGFICQLNGPSHLISVDGLDDYMTFDLAKCYDKPAVGDAVVVRYVYSSSGVPFPLGVAKKMRK